MDDLYTMSKADNIMYAKRCIVDSIYKQSRLEGIAVTFPETQEIYEGRSVSGLSVEDIIKVNNLKHGWQFIFDTIDYPLDLRYIRADQSGSGEWYRYGRRKLKNCRSKYRRHFLETGYSGLPKG